MCCNEIDRIIKMSKKGKKIKRMPMHYCISMDVTSLIGIMKFPKKTLFVILVVLQKSEIKNRNLKSKSILTKT